MNDLEFKVHICLILMKSPPKLLARNLKFCYINKDYRNDIVQSIISKWLVFYSLYTVLILRE